MGNLLNYAITIGPLALGLGLVLAAVCVVAYLMAPAPKPGTPLLRFIVLAFVIGVAAFSAGSAIGIAVFCADESSGNLCGLGGVFGVGPLASGICIGCYACFWFRGTRGAA